MTYTHILFDIDNTLLDFNKTEVFALEKSLESSGVAFELEHLSGYQAINHQYWKDFEAGKVSLPELKIGRFQSFLDSINHDTDATEFSAMYRNYLSQGSFLLDGAEELVKSLAPHFSLHIITNGFSKVQRPRLAASPITPYFESITISEEVGYKKPDKEIFDIVFEAMGQPDKKSTIIVGDSLSSDIQGGINYGIDTCWYNPEHKTTPSDKNINYVITELQDLFSIFEKKGKPNA